MMDYLLEEVLQQQTAEVQAFLLGTSVLERLCGPLCEAVMDEDEKGRKTKDEGQMAGDAPVSSFVLRPSSAVLESLERANLFIVPLDNDRQWYRYHRLFADLLRQRLQQSTADVADYHLRASHWYEANGYPAEAFQHAVAASDFDARRSWPSRRGRAWRTHSRRRPGWAGSSNCPQT